MQLAVLISALSALIIPIPTSSMVNGIFQNWQTINITVDRQNINGCFFDFIASDTYVLSKQYCTDKKCSFNSAGYDTTGKTLGAKTTLQPGEINVAAMESAIRIGNTNTTFNGPILVGLQSKLNWVCRIGLGTRTTSSNLLQQLATNNMLDSNSVSYYSIKVIHF